MPTRARYRALTWFRDHKADPLSVLMRKRPSTRMCNLMLREGQVERIAVGQLHHHRWLLTDKGATLLAAKPRRKERKGADHERGETGTAPHD